jgi:hypothetical protein
MPYRSARTRRCALLIGSWQGGVFPRLSAIEADARQPSIVLVVAGQAVLPPVRTSCAATQAPVRVATSTDVSERTHRLPGRLRGLLPAQTGLERPRLAAAESDLRDLPPEKRMVSSTVYAGHPGWQTGRHRDHATPLPHSLPYNDQPVIDKSCYFRRSCATNAEGGVVVGASGGGAVQVMEVGPPGSPCRGGLKPPQAASVKCRGGERCGKRRDVIASGGGQEGERERTADDVS